MLLHHFSIGNCLPHTQRGAVEKGCFLHYCANKALTEDFIEDMNTYENRRVSMKRLFSQSFDNRFGGFGSAEVLLTRDEIAIPNSESAPETRLHVVGPEFF
jgi:hypothetical protein